jgi:hypothetical protein
MFRLKNCKIEIFNNYLKLFCKKFPLKLKITNETAIFHHLNMMAKKIDILKFTNCIKDVSVAEQPSQETRF